MDGVELTTPGNIFVSLSAAHCAFGFPPFKQSSKSNKGCLTGFEYETLAESTNVMFRTPHPCTDDLASEFRPCNFIWIVSK